MKLSIILPCYNEAVRLPPTLREIEIFLKENKGMVNEIIVVDDGSTDATVERALRFQTRLPLRIERFPRNKGKWAAIRHGISVAKNDWVLILDADGSASIFELSNMRIDLKLLDNSKTVVFGSRFAKGSNIEGKSLLRTLASQSYRIYSKFLQFLIFGKVPVDDTQAPFKLVNRQWFSILKADRFAGDFELLCSMDKDVYIKNWPLQFIHKRGSKIAIFDSVRMASETLGIAFYFYWHRN